MNDQNVDDQRFAHGEMRAFSGVKEPTFRKWVDRGQLVIGSRLDSGRMRYSRRDLVFMRVLVELTSTCGLSITRATAAAEYAVEWWARMSLKIRAIAESDEGVAGEALAVNFMHATLLLPFSDEPNVICKSLEDLLDHRINMAIPAVMIPLGQLLSKVEVELSDFEKQ